MIQRVQTDKVVAVSTIYHSVSSLRPPLVQVQRRCFLSSLFLLLRSGSVRWTEISHRTFIKFDRGCTRESLKRKTKINEISDPTLTHYRQVLCLFPQKINGTAFFRIRMRHHFFRSSIFVPIVPIAIDFCFSHRNNGHLVSGINILFEGKQTAFSYFYLQILFLSTSSNESLQPKVYSDVTSLIRYRTRRISATLTLFTR